VNARLHESVGPFDVVVIGGGLAGICAALAAARQGASTALIHERPVLGGNSSTEIRIPPFGAGHHNPQANETGIILELLLEERARNHERIDYGFTNTHWDMTLYEAAQAESNLSLFLNTLAIQVCMTDRNRLESVIGVQSGTERTMRFTGRFFIDCTGDGSIGVACGVPAVRGQEARSTYGESLAPLEAQPQWTLGSSLLFRARDTGRPVDYRPPSWAVPYKDETALQHRSHTRIDGGYWWIEIGAPYDTIRDNEQLRHELLRHVLGVWDHIKNHCVHRQAARNYALEWVGMVPGKRESRRFVGTHVLTQNELERRELFPDRVAYGGWIIDDHTQGGVLEPSKAPSFDKADVELIRCLVAPYSIPLRTMYASQVKNLLFAGRLMSASRLAFNSLRVQSTLAVCGQAAGTAAAMCASRATEPGKLTLQEIGSIQQSLLRQDCYVPSIRNEDPADQARLAKVSASSTATFTPVLGDTWASLASPLAQLVPVSATHVEHVRVYLRNDTGTDVPLRLCVYPAADIWDLTALGKSPLESVDATVPAGLHGWFTIPVNMHTYPPQLLWFALEGTDGVSWRQQQATPPGFTSARVQDGDTWWFAPGMFSSWEGLALDITPVTRPFEPENVVSGVTRAETWPNLWMSDPQQPLPQWLQLDLPEPRLVGLVQITCDTNTSRIYTHTPPFFRSPECISDCSVAVYENGRWEEAASVSGNYQRRIVLRFTPRRVSSLRISITRAHGAPEARIFEVRLYDG
jgi:hypothetical protein